MDDAHRKEEPDPAHGPPVPLAFITARAHGLHEEADAIWASTGLPVEQMPTVPEGQLLQPLIPIAKVRSGHTPPAGATAARPTRVGVLTQFAGRVVMPAPSGTVRSPWTTTGRAST